MIDPLALHLVHLSAFGLETGLLVLILRQRVWRRFSGPFLYVLLMLAVDAFLRPLGLYFYQLNSRAYYALYWCTDAALGLATFLLVCVFVRRAGRHHRWASVLYLLLIWTLLPGVSRLYQHLRHAGIRLLADWSVDLEISALVVCVILWIVVRSSAAVERELKLLVAGLAVQLGSGAIGLAFGALTRNAVSNLSNFVSGMCTLMFLFLWWKAVVLSSSPARI